MSRFVAATICLCVALAAAAIFVEGAARWRLCAGLVAAYVTLFGFGIALIRMQFFGRVVCRGRPGAMKVALTFDDGPDAVTTPALLDALRRLGVRATFFCVGRRVAEHPDIARRIAQEGHMIGNHSFRHAWWTNFLFGRRLSEEIERTQKAVADAVGARPRYFRSPMGLTNPNLPGALRRAGLIHVGWEAGGRDRGSDAREIVRRIARRTRDGSLVLMHVGGGDPGLLVAKVDALVAELRAKGYTFSLPDELLAYAEESR